MAILNAKSTMNQNSIIEIEDYFHAVKTNGLNYAAITNDGTVHDLFEISEAAKKTGLKPIVGSKFSFKIGSNVIDLALYPRNNRGKKKLNALSTRFHKNQKRNLVLEGMKNVLHDMAIVIDAGNADSKATKEVIRTLTTFLEKNTLFVGLQETFEQDNKEKNLEIKKVLVDENIKFIPFNEIKFLKEEEMDSFNYFSKMKGIDTVEDIENVLPTVEDIEQMFDYMEDMEDGTTDIVSQIKADYIIDQESIKIPSYPVPLDFNPSEKFKKRFEEYIKVASEKQIRSAGYLWHLVFQGLVKIYGVDEVAINRAIKEMEVIVKMNFSDYFLIVWDFIDYAGKNGIIIGPGRGSVAGSIVAFCLNITKACPIKYKLQFERFLSKYRKGMPDIDVDVSQKTRGKLIAYLRRKYGKGFVSHIITRANYGFKNINNNMLKQMRVPENLVTEMMKFSPESYNSVGELIEKKPEAKELMEKSKDVRVLLEQGYALKNMPNTTSIHAAGIIISGEPLEEGGLPMMYDEGGNLVTQIQNDTDKNSLEKMGYLKFDILGLRNLDVIQMAKQLVEKKTGKPFGEIPLDDSKTLELLETAKFLAGIFQLESISAKNVIKQIGVKSFDDIVMVNAFNRPGPLDFVPVYAQREGEPIKMFDEKGNELHNVDKLYPTLQETRGIIIFQEQINELVCVWAGYNLADADVFRRAISKKDEEALKKEGEKFIKKSVEFGRDEQTTIELFKIILRFAKYGFNKSHAVVYSMITYELAYLKANHPLEFWSALLTSVGNNTKQVAEYISEARQMGIKILSPDVNLSTDEFQVEGDAIRCAFQMVNGVGVKTSKGIVEARNNVPFKHIYDVIKRIKTTSSVDNGNLEAFARIGAFDSIGERHAVLAHLSNKENATPLTLGEKVALELEGCHVEFSIPEEIREKLKNAISQKENYVAGIVEKVENKIDKYKREMARVEIISLDGDYYSPVIFSKLWKDVKNDITCGSVVLAEINSGKKGVIEKISTIKL
ncbi:DNA polymerase III subunit alpha [Bacillus thuringiensis]|uniref:DNA polymerase III subunit alpha n=1 Tax=Bacillus thuringiensis TaxID=1428 RepID=UPI0021D6499A|nr:DNA polymerase III subunit alpha [Bacillus thuringiensis]MCU7667037.1 DNA polymerase III subunit alpha [Bacillus thuringiensis]